MDIRILIVDREGTIASSLCKEFLSTNDRCEIVVVSEVSIDNASVVSIPWRRNLPTIPDLVYSHLFVAYGGEKEIEVFLPSIIQKAQRESAKCIIAVPKFLFSPKLLAKWQAMETLLILLYGDLHTVSSLLSQAREEGRVVIEGMGERWVYPVFIDDVVSSLMQLAFVDHGSTRLFFAFPKYPLTELTLLRIIKKVYPLIKLDFQKEKQKQAEHLLPSLDGIYLVEEHYPFEEKLQSGMAKRSVIDTHGGERKPFKKINSTTFFLPIVFVVVALFVPLFTASVFSFLSGEFMKRSQKELEDGHMSSFAKSIRIATAFLRIANSASTITALEASVVGQEERMRGVLPEGVLKRSFAKGLFYGQRGLTKLTRVVAGKIGGTQADLDEALGDIKAMHEIFARLKGEGYVLAVGSERMLRATEILVDVSEAMPFLLGFEREVTYVLLFRDDRVIRPGGGIIKRYALVGVENGKITKVSPHKVSDTDEHLKGHVEPPFPLRRYAKKAHWYLQDSGFSWDFQSVASTSALLLRLGTDEVVDGVFGITSSFVKHLNIRAGNTFSFNEEESAEVFVRAVESLNKKEDATLVLLEILTEALATKDVMFASFNPSVERLLQAEMPSFAKSNESDFVGVLTGNLGNSPMSHLVKRTIRHEATISEDGDVSKKVALSIENTSDTEYQQYLSLLVPKGVVVTEIVIDGKTQKIATAVTDPLVYEKKRFIAPSGLELETALEYTRARFGFFLLLGKGERKEIVVAYRLPHQEGGDKLSYAVSLFKQPGIRDELVHYTVNFPKHFSASSSPPGFVVSEGKATIGFDLAKDTVLRLAFTR